MAVMIALLVVLVAAAMVFVLLEILTPTMGLLSVLAAGAMVGAVVVAFMVSPLLGVLVIVGLALGMPVYIYALVKYLPNSPWGRKLFLAKQADPTASGTPAAGTYAELVGSTGTAETMLRPSGAIRVKGRRVIALAESGVIEKGAAVVVIKADGTNVVVRKVAR